LCRQAIAAGKHVLESPGVTVEECEALRQEVAVSGLTLQVGYMKRFDPGLSFVHDFAEQGLGQRLSFKSCYHDSIYRYTMTDNLQVIPMASPQALRPEGNPKADKRRYFMLTHGSHLVDTARYLGGQIERVNARLVERFGAYCWYIAVDFADGSVGHLDLIVAVRGDWREDFQLEAEFGNASGKIHLPWFHKTSEVEVFSTKDGLFRRPLGEDAHTYKRQVEGFAETILHGVPQHGANVEDGAEGVRRAGGDLAVGGTRRAGEAGRRDRRPGEHRHLRQDVCAPHLTETLTRRRRIGITRCSSTRPAPGCPPCPTRSATP
jgi:predicted dehydrogenase